VCEFVCTLNIFVDNHLSFPHFNFIPANRGGRCREGLEDHHIQTGPFNSIKRTLTVYSCAWEQTEHNANKLFVMSAMRNVQKHRRDHRVLSSAKRIWSSLVTMSYAICRYVLTCGGVPGIIWEVHSGFIIQRVVLSMRGCLMWGIREWGCFVSRKFVFVSDNPKNLF
jgi:hypothetical protein